MRVESKAAMERFRYLVFLALGAIQICSTLVKIWLFLHGPDDPTAMFNPESLAIYGLPFWLAPLALLYLVRRSLTLLAMLAAPIVLPLFFYAAVNGPMFDFVWGQISIGLIVLWAIARAAYFLARPLADYLRDRFAVLRANRRWPLVQLIAGIAGLILLGTGVGAVAAYQILNAPKRPAAGKFDFEYFESLREDDVLHDASMFIEQQFRVGTPVSRAVAAFEAAGANCGRVYVPYVVCYYRRRGHGLQFRVGIEWKIVITPTADGVTVQSISVNRSRPAA